MSSNGLNYLKKVKMIFKMKMGHVGKSTMASTPEMVDLVDMLISVDNRRPF